MDNSLPQSGQVWRQLDFPCHTRIVQYIRGNTYCLLSMPHKATHGGTSMMVCTDEDGSWTWTQEELAKRFDRLKYTLCQGERVEILQRDSGE